MMRRLLKVEAKRLAWNRATWGLAATAIVVGLVGALQTATLAETGKALFERQAWFLATVNMQLFLLVLGAKSVTDDFRHGTIIPATLITPGRSRIVGAKLAVLAGAGTLVAAAIAGTVVAASWSELGGLQAADLRSVVGFVVAGGLFAALGGAVGFIVRNQVGAVVGVIVWTMVFGQILGSLSDAVTQFLPGDAGGALAIGSTVEAMLYGGLILMLWSIGAGLAGAVAMNRRDVL